MARNRTNRFTAVGSLAVLLTMSAMPIAVGAATCQATSGVARKALVELYTSEGCSSCPPADRWLSGLVAQGFEPDRVVPLALHVDYWDYLGWPDRLASAAFSARQREQVKAAGGRVVYTPQVMINGRDFPAWRAGRLSSVLADTQRAPAQAKLNLALNATDAYIDVEATAVVDAARAVVLYVVVYENGLSTEVRAGENRGTRLRHDYVARAWHGPIASTAWRKRVPVQSDWARDKLGVVVFAQDRESGEVLQALQLPLCAG